MYLDANAHLPMSEKALAEYIKNQCHGNPLSPSSPGRAASLVIETARAKIAELLKCESAQIIFTSGATESCRWCIQMLNQEFSQNVKIHEASSLKTEIVCSPVEHPASFESYEDLFNSSMGPKKKRKYTEVDKNGVIDTNPNYEKVICVHVQPEIGTIQPLKQIKRKLLFSDMSQSLGKIPIDLKDLGVDFAAFGSHKFGGPVGCGFIYLRDTSMWKSFSSGSRYFLDRPGTSDVAGIASTAIALEEAINTLSERTTNMETFRDQLETGLEQLGLEIIGKKSIRCPNTTFVGGLKGYSLNILMDLSNAGFHVGLGSACGSLHTNVNRTMQILRGDTCGYNYLRISQWGEYTDPTLFLNQMEKTLKKYK